MAPPGVVVTGPPVQGDERVLTDDALAFIADLQRRFGQVRLDLLHRRHERQAELDAGGRLDFPAGTREIRETDWTVAPAPADFDDRRVEITGPAEPKMMINALNSGARVFMADLEDALSPTWANVVGGQAALMDAVRGTLAFDSPEGKSYRLAEKVAQLVVRPRGWHLVESHVLVDGVPVSASLFDAGLYLFHNAAERVARGSGPYLYLPKLESHNEARLWNEVFVHAQAGLGVPRGSIRATVLIETITAAFEMDEILFELREHAAGLNAGRWDYLFSVIKRFRGDPELSTPDRSQLTMTVPFMRAYTQLLVRTCHRRGAHAIGGMAAFIPNRRDLEVTERALAKVREDKERESRDGFDGTWVAHPDLVPVATEIFDSVLGDAPNQKDRVAGCRRGGDRLGLVRGRRWRGHRRRRSAPTCGSRWPTWTRGCAGRARPRSTTSWRMPRPRRSPARSCGCGGRAACYRWSATPRSGTRSSVALAVSAEGRLKDAWEILDHLVLDDEFAEFLTLRAYAVLE